VGERQILRSLRLIFRLLEISNKQIWQSGRNLWEKNKLTSEKCLKSKVMQFMSQNLIKLSKLKWCSIWWSRMMIGKLWRICSISWSHWFFQGFKTKSNLLIVIYQWNDGRYKGDQNGYWKRSGRSQTNQELCAFFKRFQSCRYKTGITWS